MAKIRRVHQKSLLLVAAVDILLLAAVLFLMNYVQYLLELDTKINLTEIVTQNKNVITSRLMLEVNNLDLVAKQVEERFAQAKESTREAKSEIFMRLVEEKGEDKLSWADQNGLALFWNGQQIDISGRRYFRRAMEGIQNISERTVSRMNGEDIFVICVPMRKDGVVIGSIQKQYTPQEIYDLCSVSLFSEKGHMYIINSEGYILLSSEQDKYNRESDNYFRLIYVTDSEGSKRLENDIKNGTPGFIETVIDGNKTFSAYTPIDQVYDWYLISSVDTSAVSPNANIVIKLFYCVLIVVVLFFACIMFYYLTLKRRQQANLEQIAFVDTVTNGDTLTKFRFDMQNLLPARPEGQWYIFTFDIDNFKYINKYYGFDFGDEVLTYIVNGISKQLGEKEMIARISSDNFVVFVNDASKERLLHMLDEVSSYKDIMIYYSSGVYEIKDIDENVSIMIDKASMVSNTVKEAANDKISYYTKGFDEIAKQEEELKRAIHDAFDNDEFIPYYQPKVNVETNEVIGCEALARWKSKDKGLIAPNHFIPICEKSGLIMDLDMRIFEKTLQFIQRCIKDGVKVYPISVNFSRMHLLDSSFLKKIVDKMEKYEVPRHLIELELTESAIFGNLDSILTFTNHVHEYGLKLAMDDFGSGYSSLNMLKEIPIDVLKVDKEFLNESSDNERRRIIFESMVEMVRKLNIEIIVEGVETLEGVQLLKDCNCYFAQGFYFSKPVSEETIYDIYRKGKVE